MHAHRGLSQKVHPSPLFVSLSHCPLSRFAFFHPSQVYCQSEVLTFYEKPVYRNTSLFFVREYMCACVILCARVCAWVFLCFCVCVCFSLAHALSLSDCSLLLRSLKLSTIYRFHLSDFLFDHLSTYVHLFIVAKMQDAENSKSCVAKGAGPIDALVRSLVSFNTGNLSFFLSLSLSLSLPFSRACARALSISFFLSHSIFLSFFLCLFRSVSLLFPIFISRLLPHTHTLSLSIHILCVCACVCVREYEYMCTYTTL